jgi:hypothetical protein
MSKKKTGINPELEKHINKLLEQVMLDETASITEKMKVVDRALKLEQLKAKISDDEYGSGFFDHDDGEDDKDI